MFAEGSFLRKCWGKSFGGILPTWSQHDFFLLLRVMSFKRCQFLYWVAVPLCKHHSTFVVMQVLEVYIKDSHLTGRPDVGKVEFPLAKLKTNESLTVWLPVLPVNPNQQAQGELHLDLTYRVSLCWQCASRSLVAQLPRFHPCFYIDLRYKDKPECLVDVSTTMIVPLPPISCF